MFNLFQMKPEPEKTIKAVDYPFLHGLNLNRVWYAERGFCYAYIFTDNSVDVFLVQPMEIAG